MFFQVDQKIFESLNSRVISLNPKSQDGKETRITQITTKRSKPTMAAMEEVLFTAQMRT